MVVWCHRLNWYRRSPGNRHRLRLEANYKSKRRRAVLRGVIAPQGTLTRYVEVGFPGPHINAWVGCQVLQIKLTMREGA